MLDVVSGLLLMLATLGLLGTLLTRSRLTAGRLADDRAATRLAEATLLTLAATADAPADPQVSVAMLDASAPEGRRWASVTATVGARHANLIGLVATTRPTSRPAEVTR